MLAHTADVGIEARGPDLASVFEEAALAVAELTADRSVETPPAVDPGAARARPDPQRAARAVRHEASDPAALAYAWLNELVATIDIDGALADVRVTAVASARDGRWTLEGAIVTEPFDGARVRRRADVKSATYHGLVVEPVGEAGWVLTAYLDV